MKYLLTTIAIISFSVFADNHKNLPKPDDCEGKPANYYVAKGKLFTPEQSRELLSNVIENATTKDSGNLLAYDGETISP